MDLGLVGGPSKPFSLDEGKWKRSERAHCAPFCAGRDLLRHVRCFSVHCFPHLQTTSGLIMIDHLWKSGLSDSLSKSKSFYQPNSEYHN